MDLKHVERYVEKLPVFELEGIIMGGEGSMACRDRIQEIIKSGEKFIILDFGKVKWINSTGIGMMIACRNELIEKGGELFFVNLPEKIKYYFKITKLNTVLKIHKNIDDVVTRVFGTNVC